MGVVCIRSQPHDAVSATPQSPVMLENPNASGVPPPSNDSMGLSALSHGAISFHQPSVVNQGEGIAPRLPPARDATFNTPGLGQMSRGTELEELVRLYFSSVHRESVLSIISSN